ncbi:prepilin-type N-terminal cleavage/methylation domain-containing protein, partial [Candidatus Gracilibacteria bacterium]|nr:prepilin-type N-terminal cleavage/methylation domain-containing protein [Candidatus Gracilibacteria bacterium]
MQNKRALTLVELVVVITILSILSTIAYISLAGQATDARDASRGTDINSINRVLTLHNTSRLQYPKATNSFSVTYSGATLWNQGVFGKETLTEVGKIFGELQDPKFDNQYTYSVTQNKKEYQLGALFENEDNKLNVSNSIALTAPSFFNSAYAAGEFSPLELLPKIWLDGEDIDGDGDNSDNPSNGGSVTSWVNKSSAGITNNPTFTHGNLRYSTTGVGGAYPGVFIANNRGLRLENSDITAGDIFYVVDNNDPFGGDDTNGRALQSTTGNYLIGFHGYHRNSIYINGAPDKYNSTPATTNGRKWTHIYGFHTDGSNYEFYRSGQRIGSPGATNSITGREWGFNKAGNFPNESADWIISEVLIFDSLLSTADRQKVEGYLAHKWGRVGSLPGSHPYKLAPPESSGPPPTPDSTPDAFSFGEATDADVSTLYTSNPVTVTGINTSAAISISGVGGEYSINSTNDSAYTNAAGTVNDGDILRVRQTSASSDSTTTKITLNVGGVTGDYDVTTFTADTTPDAYNFTAISDADVSTLYTSNAITVSGLNTSVPITISGNGAEYSISDNIPVDATGAGSAFASHNSTTGTVNAAFDNNTFNNGWGNTGSLPAQLGYNFGASNGEIITQYSLYRSSSQSGWWFSSDSPRNWTFEGSNDNSNWTLLDTQVNQYIFNDNTKKTYSFPNTIDYQYYRINVSATNSSDGSSWINITEMELIKDGTVVFTSNPSTVSNGEVISVRIPSSGSAGIQETATLDIGSSSSDFNVTTVGPDTSPDSFSFTDEIDATPSTLYIRTINVTGINTSTNASMTGNGVFVVNGVGGGVTSATVSNGDQIQVQVTSGAFGTTRSAVLTVGSSPSVSATFNVSTQSPPPDLRADNFSFIDRDNAALSTQYASNSITVTGITADINIAISAGGEYDINGTKVYTSLPGTVSNGDTVSLRATSSASVNDDVDITLTLGSLS